MTKKILVIDDDKGILEAFQAMLESAGYTVEIAADADALLQNKKVLPSLLILDVLLSGSDGREVAKKLKSNENTKHIPIIMMSAHPNIQKSIKDAGADDFLAKPFEMDELLQKVAHYIGKSE